ncbi:SMC5-SMC6 complex localization factor protein 1 [Lithobates pipiens]
MEVPVRQVIVQLTGFRDAEKDSLAGMLSKLPCEFIDSEKFKSCTHLIAKNPCRSEKWLAACASGKWVLTKEYVINSAESGRWLDETTYEWGYKMERDAHYSPQMQAAPKRWREHLTHSRALGAFSRWKVVLLIENADKERESFLRILAAGQATVCDAQKPEEGVTHVFTNNKSLNDRERSSNAPYYSVLYLGEYLLEDPIENISREMTEEQIAELKSSIWKRFCMAQICRQRCTRKFTGFFEKLKVKRNEIGQSSWNRIEELIDGHFFTEAFGEIENLLPSLFPQKCFMSLLKNLIQGHVDINHFGQFFGVFSNLLHYHPPWESVSMSQFYLNILQCPICKKGTWSFIEALIRCFIDDAFCLCHKTFDLEIDTNKRRQVVAAVLKFVTNIMQEEAKSLSARLSERTESHKTLFPSFIVGVFWPETRTMVFLNKNLTILTDLVIMSYKKELHSKSVLSEEIATLLNGMLAATVDFWILLGFYLNKNLLHQVASDFLYYICVSCEEFTLEEKEQFVCSIASSWLQMLVSEMIFKNLYLESSVNMPPEPITLEKLTCTYIPALWKAGARSSEKVQKLQGKRKIGQRPCLESQRALLMLNGENQNQGEVLLDLPIASKLRKRTQGGADATVPQFGRLKSSCQNRKGETVLHRICRSNNVLKLTEQLSLPGVSVNAKDNAGWTPLHEACNHGSTECVREILQRCPEVDLLSHVDGVTPLHDALQNRHIDIGKILLQHGGPVLLQQMDCFGNFPLDYVCSPHLKNELFAIIQVEETIEEFHNKTVLKSEGHKLEFGAFLLTRMLLNVMCLYGLPSDLGTAKIVCPNSAFLFSYTKKTPSSFNNSIVECYIGAVATMHNLSDFLNTVPDSLLQNPGFNVQVLFTLLRTLASCSSVPLME